MNGAPGSIGTGGGTRPKDGWDEHVTFDSDWGTNREFKCPKFDLFGCGCAEVEGYETLSGGDCAVLKVIMKTRRDCEYAEAGAMSCASAGMGKFDLMDKTAELVAAEDPFAFYDGSNSIFGE